MTQGPTMPPPPPPTAPRVPGAATACLVCGIGSLVMGFVAFCLLLGAMLGLASAGAALILASMADKELAASGGLLGGADQVRAGRIMGYVGLGLNVVGLVVHTLIIILYIAILFLGWRHR